MRDGAAGAIRRGHIAIGNRRLYLDCRGQTGPTVLIDVGLGFKPGTEQWGWFPIRDAVLPHARVCLYDRAGQGQSDPPPTPLTIGDYVQDLHRLLHAAALPAPYLLVGGSIGGLIVWLYGARYPQEVGGIVLVDSAHPRQWQRMLDLLSSAGDAEAPAVVAFRRSEIDTVIDAARNEEHMNLPDSIAQFVGVGLGGLPLIVLTAGKAEWEAGFPAELAAQVDHAWLELQHELAALSTTSTHRIIVDSGHCMHADRPDIVVEAILQLVRNGARPGAITEGVAVQ